MNNLTSDFYGLSHPGRQRNQNEDHFFISSINRSMLIEQSSLPIDDWSTRTGTQCGKLLMVADGVGGHPDGHLAGGLAVYTAARQLLEAVHLPGNGESPVGPSRQMLRDVLQNVESQLQFHQGEPHMATTLTLALITWPRMTVVHVGDSRCYVMRDKDLIQLTTDHTIARQLVEEGVLAADQQAYSRWRHVLWNALGGDHEGVTPQACRFDLQPGDQVLLCTNGLHQQLDQSDIARILYAAEDSVTACAALISQAVVAGGTDDATAVVGRFAPTEQYQTQTQPEQQPARELAPV